MRYKAGRTKVLPAFFYGKTTNLPKITNTCMAQIFSLRLAWLSILTLHLFLIIPSLSWAIEKVSLKNYPQISIQVPNPMVTSRLPARKTFQVNHDDSILQLFFNERDRFRYILKRNKKHPIHFRWCFFKSCDESPYDFKKVIAEPFSPPYATGFFSIRFPSYLHYSFQGIEFSSPK